jgi:hypothetical protein
MMSAANGGGAALAHGSQRGYGLQAVLGCNPIGWSDTLSTCLAAAIGRFPYSCR